MFDFAAAAKWIAIASIVGAVGYGLLDYKKQSAENARNKQVIETMVDREEAYKAHLSQVNEYVKGMKDSEAIRRTTEKFLNRIDVREIIEQAEDRATVAVRISVATNKRLRQLEQVTEVFVSGQSKEVQQVQGDKESKSVPRRQERKFGPRK